jgi:hypothetical protein
MESRRPSPARKPKASSSRLKRLLAPGLCVVFLSGCGLIAGTATTSSPPTPTSPYNRFVATEQKAFDTALSSLHGVSVPKKPGAPAPILPAGAFGSGLGSHVVLGFLPSWEIYSASSVNYSAFSEIAYFALQLEPGGSILTSGAGWQPLADGAVDTFVADAHQAGDRALLTLFTQTQSTLDQMAKAPAADGHALADRVAPLLSAHGFDGVDFDIEGQQGADRSALVAFIAAFSSRLHVLGPRYSIVLNSYPQAAVDPSNFFDVKALSPYVDQFFVMAYDMNDQSSPGATAPLLGQNLSDASSVASYEAVVPASKIILGIPFYGYDFTASRKSPPAITVGTPYAVSYADVVAAGRTAQWDPSSETPYESFKRAGQWHQTWFDDPVSVALKVALAAAFHTAGVGAWEIGMAGGQPAMITALDGGSSPERLPLAGG